MHAKKRSKGLLTSCRFDIRPGFHQDPGHLPIVVKAAQCKAVMPSPWVESTSTWWPNKETTSAMAVHGRVRQAAIGPAGDRRLEEPNI